MRDFEYTIHSAAWSTLSMRESMPDAERDEHDAEHTGGARGVSLAEPESCSICGHEAERQMERSIVTW